MRVLTMQSKYLAEPECPTLTSLSVASAVTLNRSSTGQTDRAYNDFIR